MREKASRWFPRSTTAARRPARRDSRSDATQARAASTSFRVHPSTSIRRPLVIAFLLYTRFSFTRILFAVRIEESLERSSTRIDLRQSISRAVHVTLPRLATKDQDHRFAEKNRSSCSQLFCVSRGRSGSFVRPRLLTYARACVTVYQVTKHRREGPATTRDHL